MDDIVYKKLDFDKEKIKEKQRNISYLMQTGRKNPSLSFLSFFEGEIEVESVSNSDIVIAESVEETEISTVLMPIVDADRYKECLLDALAHAGIVSVNYKVNPKFHPHGREFYKIPELGDFKIDGEIVDSWHFPDMGAERITKSKLGSTGVVTPQGVVSVVRVNNLIDAARIKLDGDEEIVFNISTATKTISFYWSVSEIIRLNDVTLPGHYENVNGRRFLLNGHNYLKANVHEWKYLTTQLVEESDSVGDGLIIRMSGKQYRIKRYRDATLEVKGRKIFDYHQKCYGTSSLPDGLYDFKEKSGEWIMVKARKDKNHADTTKGIQEMLKITVTMKEFVANVLIPRGESKVIPSEMVYITTSGEIVELIGRLNCAQTHPVLIRTSKMTDSSTRQGMSELDNYRLSSFDVLPIEENQIVVSGMMHIIDRQKNLRFFEIKGRLYTTLPSLGHGNPIYVVLKGEKDMITFMGKKRMRIFEMALTMEEYKSKYKKEKEKKKLYKNLYEEEHISTLRMITGERVEIRTQKKRN